MHAGILHTIVFHRALGLVRPKDIDSELFEITYVTRYLCIIINLISTGPPCLDSPNIFVVCYALDQSNLRFL